MRRTIATLVLTTALSGCSFLEYMTKGRVEEVKEDPGAVIPEREYSCHNLVMHDEGNYMDCTVKGRPLRLIDIDHDEEVDLLIDRKHESHVLYSEGNFLYARMLCRMPFPMSPGSQQFVDRVYGEELNRIRIGLPLPRHT